MVNDPLIGFVSAYAGYLKTKGKHGYLGTDREVLARQTSALDLVQKNKITIERIFQEQTLMYSQLSDMDRKMLRLLLDSEGTIPTHEISQQLVAGLRRRYNGVASGWKVEVDSYSAARR